MTLLALVLVFGATAAVILYGLWGWEQIVRRRQDADAGSPAGAWRRARDARPATEADAPRALGRDACWIAVPSADANAVARALELRTVLPANWVAGLAESRAGGVFVAPPVAGTVLVVGRDLLGNAAPETVLVPRLQQLSQRFGRAAWFCADDSRGVFGWALAERGVLLRGYAYTELDGPVFWHGEPLADERRLGCFVDDPRDASDDADKWWPDRAIVHALAAAWSLDPDQLPRLGAVPGVGVVGHPRGG